MHIFKISFMYLYIINIYIHISIRLDAVHLALHDDAWQARSGVEVSPPWRQPKDKSMISSLTNATRIWWHLLEIELSLPLSCLQDGFTTLSTSTVHPRSRK